MKIAKEYQKEVFCLEGDWSRNLKKQTSIHATLLFLKQNRDIDFIYRQCGTRENLAFYLKQWQLKRYQRYSILYLAFHGKPLQILIDKKPISLDELAEMLGDKCQNRIIHFGSCQTLNTDKRHIKRFLKKTNALCVCGFGKEIKFVESSVFDILLIDLFQDYLDVSRVEATLKSTYASLVKKLEFRLIHL
ncbi:MAG: hypothetical protein K9H61_13835 [Bacteroidia bacterium]|nr:hypothetical protein [Bacteroidia bacterium]MCF8425718.1 hypothetical protein [Bacteroidia bacterium]MCF8448066.1 hypothetical protein [Bacteroidia bacterium]